MPRLSRPATALLLLTLGPCPAALGKHGEEEGKESAAPAASKVGGVGQRCGGVGWTGAKTCPDKLFCNHTNKYWWDCQAGEPPKDRVEYMTSGEIVALLNSRFLNGGPNNDLKATGVLVHQFHNGNDGDWKAWMPCPATCYGGPCWCASFSDRFSASILNGKTMTKKGVVGMYSMQNPGFIYNPDIVTVACAYPADGGSESKSCKPGATGCVSGCSDKWCHFDPTMPNNMDTSCAWPPSELEHVLNLQIGAHSNYNEIVVPASDVVDNLPTSIMAIFYVKGSKAADEARKVHDDFLATFPGAANIPLVEMDPTRGDAPFTDVSGNGYAAKDSLLSPSASAAIKRLGASNVSELSPLFAAVFAVVLAGVVGGLAVRRRSTQQAEQPDMQALLHVENVPGDFAAEKP